jgi:hypothetical protein
LNDRTEFWIWSPGQLFFVDRVGIMPGLAQGHGDFTGQILIDLEAHDPP